MAGAQRKPSALGRWLRLLLSVSLIGVLFSQLDVGDVSATFAQVRWHLVALVVVLEFGNRLFSAHRWYIVLLCTNPEARWRDVVRETFVATFMGQFLPGAVGTEALRVYGMGKNLSDLAGAFSSVLVDRMIGLLSLVAMVTLGLAAAPHVEALAPVAMWAWISLGALAVTSFILMHGPSRALCERLLPRVVATRIEAKLAKLYHCLDQYKGWKGRLTWAMALSMLFQVNRVAVYLVAVLALGVKPDVLAFFTFVPIVIFSGMLPISIGGVGVREAGFVYLLSTYGGLANAPAIAASVMVLVIMVVSTIPGAWYYAAGRKAEPVEVPEEDEPAPVAAR